MAYGLYIHIPYCHSRCRYCDFYTAGAAAGVPDAYIMALLRDFARYAPKGPKGEAQRPQTVYFGGGTPSLLLPQQVEDILRAVRPLAGAEITLEANPESATVAALQGYRAAGVNRLSIGVQSARDASLRTLGRLHTAQQAREAFAHARAAGFNNLSGDIMMALPHYTREEFDDTLTLLQNGGASHISAYLLKIEEGTPFAKQPPAGLPGADEAADFYLYAVQALERAGYAQYEISNFARCGAQSRHNLIYWNCEDYLGIGAAAHSCLGGQRFSFAADTEAFLCGQNTPQPEGAADADDYVMLRLRLAEGLQEAPMQARYGVGLRAPQQALLADFVAHGLARKTKDGWALTPEGMLVQNAILTKLL